MINETLDELRSAIAKSHEALNRELSRLRTGRATPDILDSVRVDYYGTPTPISQVAAVTVPEPRMIMIKPWDKTVIRLIEKAIVDSPLGLNPQNDGEQIRVPMPALTEQRRKELAKLARGHGEDSKVAIRKARHECRDMLEQIKKSGSAGEDEVERASKKMEEIVVEGTNQTDAIVVKKEKDITQI